MENNTKKPDRINISKRAKDIVADIDKLKYFALHDTAITRSELFAFAMALGVDTVPTKLESLYPGGLILEKSIDSRTQALIYAMYINGLKEESLDEITRKDLVYSLAQEYANTGFEIIADYMSRKKDTDLIWDLFEELETQYQSIDMDLNRGGC